MTEQASAVLAAMLMRAHRLQDWTFQWGYKKHGSAHCDHGGKRIVVQLSFRELCTDEELMEAVKRCVADALVGPEHDRDGTWKAVAERIGCQLETELGAGRWRALCKQCFRRFSRRNEPKAQHFCGDCGPEHGTLLFLEAM